MSGFFGVKDGVHILKTHNSKQTNQTIDTDKQTCAVHSDIIRRYNTEDLNGEFKQTFYLFLNRARNINKKRLSTI